MAEQENQPWDYKSSGAAVAERPDPQVAAGQPPDSRSSMIWTASEFIEHQRGIGWYVLLVIFTAALAAGAYLISKEYFAVAIIILVGIIVGIAAGRKPRQIQYELNNQGIHIGAKFYKYSDFRSFSIIREGVISSVEFSPIKKTRLPVAAYFGPGDEERIMDIIGQHLPYEERQLDAVDKLSRRLRF